MPANIDEFKIAGRYAKALFEQAEEEQALDTTMGDLKAILDVLNNVPELSVFLANPGIPQSAKLEFLKTQMESKVSRLVANLLRLMVENDRMAIFPALVEKYQAMLDERNNVATAEVVTAEPLDEELEDRLRHSLKSLYGFADVNLDKKVDPAILGGAIVKIQGKIIDGSFAGRLDALKKQVG